MERFPMLGTSTSLTLLAGAAGSAHTCGWPHRSHRCLEPCQAAPEMHLPASVLSCEETFAWRFSEAALACSLLCVFSPDLWAAAGSGSCDCL